MAYLFGAWNSFDAFINEGAEGLLINPNTRAQLTAPQYVGAYREGDLRSDSDFYEVDPNQDVLAQVDFKNMTRYVNDSAMDEYRRVSDDVKQKLDMGGVLEKDRLKPSEDSSGVFDFGLAAPSLYRMIEWYVEELDELVDGNFVEKIDMGDGTSNYYTFIEGKNYRVRRQQKGTFDILKNVPNSQLIMVGENMFATKPTSGIGADGVTYRLKFATKNKKIYLVRPKKGGAPQYLDIFVPIGGLASVTSSGMLAKVSPILMVAEQMEQAGVKVRVYGLRTYKVDGDTIFYSWLAKEYGAPLDINAISIATADPRFFRWTLWQTSEGITRKRFSKERRGYGETLTDSNELNNVFQRFKNYLWNQKMQGLFDTKVNDKSLMVVGGLLRPNNDFQRNEREITDEFYRIGDLSEMLLAKDVEKAIRRIVQRERNRGLDDFQVRSRLVQEINQAFQVITQRQDSVYFTPLSDVPKIDERREKIISAINLVLS